MGIICFLVTNIQSVDDIITVNTFNIKSFLFLLEM